MFIPLHKNDKESITKKKNYFYRNNKKKKKYKIAKYIGPYYSNL